MLSLQITGPANALPAVADGFVQAIGTWYEEIDRYNYDKPGALSASRSYTHRWAR